MVARIKKNSPAKKIATNSKRTQSAQMLKAQKAYKAAVAEVETKSVKHTAVGILGLNAATKSSDKSRTINDRVRVGLPVTSLESLANRLDMTTSRLSEQYLDISRPTLTRRRQSGHLTPGESDRAVRFARLLELATELMDSDEVAGRRWLTSPLPILRDESPLQYARTEVGAREVEQLIGRLEHGVYS